MPLIHRLSFRIPLLLVVLGSALLFINYLDERRHETAHVLQAASQSAQHTLLPLRAVIAPLVSSGKFQPAVTPLSLAADQPGMQHLLLLDKNGRVLLSGHPDQTAQDAATLTAFEPESSQQARQTNETRSRISHTPPYRLQVYMPVKAGKAALLYWEQTLETAVLDAQQAAWNRLMKMLAGLALMCVLTGAALHLLLTRRLSQLFQIKQRIAEGDYSARAPHAGDDEISGMAEGLNQALDKLAHEIAVHRQAQQELSVAAAAFETDGAMLITDPLFNIVRVNRAFENISGYRNQELVGQAPRILFAGKQDDARFQAMWETLSREGSWSGEIWDRRKSGEIYPQWLTLTAVRRDGEIAHFVAAYFDIAERKRDEEEIRNLAFFDPLTKLPNRRLLQDRMKLALAQSERANNYGAVMFIDLDNFKVLNDTKGHEYGDKMLVAVAQRICACIRETDSAARFGGDEFVVLLEGLSPQQEEAVNQAGHIAEKIREALNVPYALDETQTFESSPSIGVVLFSGDAQSMEELFKRADLAMYQSKENGRNQVRFFEPRMQAILESRTLMEGALKHALENNELELHYQLQTNEQKELLGAEVLLRWRNPAIGLVPPSEFIPLAEKTKLIIPIGHWVLQQACQQLKLWETDPVLSQLHLAVNISPVQFHQPEFVHEITSILVQTGANPNRLELELTENLVLEDVQEASSKMSTLKKVGVRFSMDDFGTGYSSLQYIKSLPIDQLKIDQSFIRDILTDPGDAMMVQTITGMAHNFGFDVIAEGVETPGQVPPLLNHGCNTFQGYLFSKPLPLEQFKTLVKTW